MADATAAYNEADNITQGEEFKAKEKLSIQWNDTIEARRWLRNFNAAKQSKAKQEALLETARTNYEELKGAQAWLVSDAEETQNKLKSIEEEIKSEKDKANIYAQAQTVVGLMESIVAGNKKIDTENKNVEKAQEKLNNELTVKSKQTKKAYEETKQAYDEQDATQKSLEQDLASRQLPELREEKEKRQTILNDTFAAMTKLELTDTERERYKQKKKDIEEQEETINKLTEELTYLAPQTNDAQVKAQTCREVLDKQRESVDNWAKTMRGKLNIGDTCPVCQQIIINILPREEEIDGLYAAAEQLWKEADKKLNELKDQEKRILAEIKSHTKVLNKAKSELETDQTLSKVEDEAKKACLKCGVDSTNKEARTILNALHEEAETAIRELNQKISAADEIVKALDDCRKATEKKRKALEMARKEMEESDHAIEECQNGIITSKALINSKNEEIAIANGKVNEILNDSQWKADRTTEIRAFIEELTFATERYNDKKTEQQNLQQNLKEKQTLLGHVAQPLDTILTQLPEWKMTAEPTKEIKKLLDKANNLRTSVHSILEQRKAAENAAFEALSLLDKYLASNTEMNMAKLSELDVNTADEITTLDMEIAKVRETRISTKSILEEIKKQQLEHIENRPELKDEDTTVTLMDGIETIDNEYNSLTEKKGALNLLLSQDETNKKTQATLIEDASKKKDVYQQWSRINQLLGDATGSKFRKIAQSYVLTNLINAANSYMRTLTERYTLKVEPGTFVIMLEDAYQGYVSRAASTISGGEGFLVSLALALALSDIGHTLSVDTLFIDEGFGTLSGEPLQKAIDTLRNLHNKSARNVGIISHVEELREKIPVQIQVVQEGHNSSSKVNVVG